jgi:hypothetical protein
VRNYEVWGSFNRDTGHGFYKMNEAGYCKSSTRGPWIHDWKTAQSLSIGWQFNSFLIAAKGGASDIVEE